MPNSYSSWVYVSPKGLESIQAILTRKKLASNALFVFLGGGIPETLISFHTIIHHNQREHSEGNTISQLLITSKA